MKCVDVLSDTVYREQAVKQLDALLSDGDAFPVERSQIYGLRQIARQQPGEVKNFADHQKDRAKNRYDNASERAKPKLQYEIDFWERVIALCSASTQGWSVPHEGRKHLPEELQNTSLTRKQRKERKNWLDNQWNNDHIPAFFERFCTEALYREGTVKRS